MPGFEAMPVLTITIYSKISTYEDDETVPGGVEFAFCISTSNEREGSLVD